MTDRTEGPTEHLTGVVARLVMGAHELRDRAEALVEDACDLLGVEIQGDRCSETGTWQEFNASEDPSEFFELLIAACPNRPPPVKKPAFDPDLSHLCESPIETAFYNACAKMHAKAPEFVVLPQYEIPPYRADFYIEAGDVVIELDGHDYHKTKEQRGSDAKRDRELVQRGIGVLRFTGSEIHADVDACVVEAMNYAYQRHEAGTRRNDLIGIAEEE